MKPIEVKAHLNSMDGKTGRAILLGPNYLFARPITNSYVFKVGGQLCTGVMNWFVGEGRQIRNRGREKRKLRHLQEIHKGE